MEIRPLLPAESSRSASIHHEVLGMEFLARFGPGFLAAYHRAWAASPAGLALVALDRDHSMTGVVLASVDPATHYRWMLTHAGPELGLRLAAQSVRHPALARQLVATRATRYARAVWRQLARTPVPAAGIGPRSGEVTHLMVRPAARGLGTGAALLAEVERRALLAGSRELVLVTPPDLEARRFYEHLGWTPTGAVTSRSGELFIRFSRQLTQEQAESAEDVGLAP